MREVKFRVWDGKKIVFPTKFEFFDWRGHWTHTEDGIEKEIRIRDSIGFSSGCFKVEKRVELLFNKQAPHIKLEIIGNIYENPELINGK